MALRVEIQGVDTLTRMQTSVEDTGKRMVNATQHVILLQLTQQVNVDECCEHA